MTPRPTCRNWPRNAPRDVPRRTSPRPTPFAIGSPSAGWTVVDDARGLAAGADRRRRGAVGPRGGPRRRLGAGRAGHGRRVDPLGRRGVAAGRAPRDRFVPGERGRSRRPLRRRRCDRRAAGRRGETTWRSCSSSPAPDGAPRATPGSSGRAAASSWPWTARSRRRATCSARSRPRSRIPPIGVCGPFGIVTPDLREFDSTDGPEADAIEGYCMAFRREILTTAGLFDEKFRWYRTADIEYSFRDQGSGPARRGRARARSSATSTGCGSRRRRRTERGGRSGTSTGSSIDGATGTT